MKKEQPNFRQSKRKRRRRGNFAISLIRAIFVCSFYQPGRFWSVRYCARHTSSVFTPLAIPKAVILYAQRHCGSQFSLFQFPPNSLAQLQSTLQAKSGATIGMSHLRHKRAKDLRTDCVAISLHHIPLSRSIHQNARTYSLAFEAARSRISNCTSLIQLITSHHQHHERLRYTKQLNPSQHSQHDQKDYYISQLNSPHYHRYDQENFFIIQILHSSTYLNSINLLPRRRRYRLNHFRWLLFQIHHRPVPCNHDKRRQRHSIRKQESCRSRKLHATCRRHPAVQQCIRPASRLCIQWASGNTDFHVRKPG